MILEIVVAFTLLQINFLVLYTIKNKENPEVGFLSLKKFMFVCNVLSSIGVILFLLARFVFGSGEAKIIGG